MVTAKSKKDEIYWTVLNTALELEFKKGHLKWTMTELSKKSKITRSLIYYYFGRSKMEILTAAVALIGEELVGINENRVKLWREKRFEQSLKEARDFYNKLPFLCAFYLNYRTKDNEIGRSLLKLEQRFIKKVKDHAPKATVEQINTLFAVYFGIAFSPHVGDGEIKIFSRFVEEIFDKLGTVI